MSDNPFDEDSDRTVIRPAPGGFRSARVLPGQPSIPAAAAGHSPRIAAAPSRPGRSLALDDTEQIILGLNPLVEAAGPLLSLIGRLARTSSQPDPVDLRERSLDQLRIFEQNAKSAGLAPDLVIKARYVLCASLDDVAQSTEWGRDSIWGSRPLVSDFRESLRGYEGIQTGVGFFRLLNDAAQRPGTEMPLLELMFLCLSLGFLGELRVAARPNVALDRLRQDLYAIIARYRPASDPVLAPHWPGEAAPYKPPGAVMPSWVLGAAALAIIGALFVWFSAGLNAASDDVFYRMVSAPLATMPQIARPQPVRAPPPLPPQTPAPESLAIFLKPEIDQGLLEVLGDRATPVVRIRNRGLFASGSGTVSRGYRPLLDRIAQALQAERGPVQVVGYTDNQPIRTVRFPSNFELSKIRAEAAGAIIARALGEPARVTVQGRGDAEPISSNETAAGRDDNRRIEVVLHRQDQ